MGVIGRQERESYTSILTSGFWRDIQERHHPNEFVSKLHHQTGEISFRKQVAISPKTFATWWRQVRGPLDSWNNYIENPKTPDSRMDIKSGIRTGFNKQSSLAGYTKTSAHKISIFSPLHNHRFEDKHLRNEKWTVWKTVGRVYTMLDFIMKAKFFHNRIDIIKPIWENIQVYFH